MQDLWFSKEDKHIQAKLAAPEPAAASSREWNDEKEPFLYSCASCLARDVGPTTESELRNTFAYIRHGRGGGGGGVHWKLVSWFLPESLYIPHLRAVREYRAENASADLFAGLLVAAAAVPMGISYARLAGLPPVHGLYNIFFHTIVYFVLGSTCHVAVGVSAIESMLSAEAVAAVIGPDASPTQWLNTSLSLGLFVGVLLIVFRLFRAGVIARFLADPVLSGFATGAAVQIATSQLRDILDVPVARGSAAVMLYAALANLPKANWRTVAVAAVSFVFITAGNAARRTWKKFPVPGALLALVVGAGLSVIGALPNVPTIGPIKAGLPRPQFLSLELALIPALLINSVLYAVLYFVIHVSVAKGLARKNGQLLDTDQELLALGACGIIGSFFQCFAPATSLSRSSLALVAATPLWMCVAAGAVAVAVFLLPPILAVVPLATLAAVIVDAVRHMAQWSDGARLLRLRSWDSFLWAGTTIAVIFGSCCWGVAFGVGASLLWLLVKVAAPRIVVLGRLPGGVYRDIRRFPAAVEEPGIRIVRFDASLNFANAEVLDAAIERVLVGDRRRPHFPCKCLIIDASSINDLDWTALRVLATAATRLRCRNQLLLFANWKGPQRDFLERCGFHQVVSQAHCFLTLSAAVQWATAARASTCVPSSVVELPRMGGTAAAARP